MAPTGLNSFCHMLHVNYCSLLQSLISEPTLDKSTVHDLYSVKILVQVARSAIKETLSRSELYILTSSDLFQWSLIFIYPADRACHTMFTMIMKKPFKSSTPLSGN